ncbi:uncharacterized protein LOC144656706 [Oculina patagonica]
MEKIFKGLGIVTGKFYNTSQDWKNAPTWVKQTYEVEQQQHCGDISSISGGAIHGALDAVAEIAKQNPQEAAVLGMEVARKAGVKEEHGLAFASGFLETAKLK